jgi:hypothetical protein
MVWTVVALVVVLLGLGYWWSSRRGRGVDRQALYERRVTDERRVSDPNTPGSFM